MKTILITGATGAIGSELIHQILVNDVDSKIIALVRNPKKAKKELPKNDRISFIVGDVTDSNTVSQACKNIDVAYHLAAVIPTQVNGEIEKSRAINIEGTRNVVDGLTKYSPEAFLFFSSSVAIYGDRIKNPDIKITDPLSYHDDDFYSYSKDVSEKIIQESTLNWSIFRLTAIMGIGNHKLNPLIFHVPLETKMEIATVKDTARAFLKSMQYRPQLNKQIYNLGGGENCRLTYREFMQHAFDAYGMGEVKFPNHSFAEKGFHCGYMMDSDVLENILHFRQDTIETYFIEFKSAVPSIQRIVTRPLAGIVRKYLTTLSEPLEAYKKGDKEKIEKFFELEEM